MFVPLDHDVIRESPFTIVTLDHGVIREIPTLLCHLTMDLSE